MIAAKRGSLWPCWFVSSLLISWAWASESHALKPLHRSWLAMSDPGLNRTDAQRVEQGYYETLLSAGRSLDRIGADQSGKHASGSDESQHPFKHGWLAEPSNDILEYRLKADIAVLDPAQ